MQPLAFFNSSNPLSRVGDDAPDFNCGNGVGGVRACESNQEQAHRKHRQRGNCDQDPLLSPLGPGRGELLQLELPGAGPAQEEDGARHDDEGGQQDEPSPHAAIVEVEIFHVCPIRDPLFV